MKPPDYDDLNPFDDDDLPWLIGSNESSLRKLSQRLTPAQRDIERRFVVALNLIEPAEVAAAFRRALLDHVKARRRIREPEADHDAYKAVNSKLGEMSDAQAIVLFQQHADKLWRELDEVGRNAARASVLKTMNAWGGRDYRFELAALVGNMHLLKQRDAGTKWELERKSFAHLCPFLGGDPGLRCRACGQLDEDHKR